MALCDCVTVCVHVYVDTCVQSPEACVSSTCLVAQTRPKPRPSMKQIKPVHPHHTQCAPDHLTRENTADVTHTHV